MIDLSNIWTLGTALNRPESILACADGFIYVSDKSHGIARISPDGSVMYAGHLPDLPHTFVPNGIALQNNGDFLISNIGDDGGIWRLDKTGKILPYLVEFAGYPAPPVNFIMLDARNRLWISVSTTLSPRNLAYRRNVANGFIAIFDQDGFRVVADGLAYTNEIRLHPSGDWLYVSETLGGRISRFRVADNGSLEQREVFGLVEPGDFVDGIDFDADGGLWAICIVSNRVYRFDAMGTRDLIFEETPEVFVQGVIAALDKGEMHRQHFDQTPNKKLRNVTSIAFAGTDRSLAVLGNLCGESLVAFKPGVRGISPIHWTIKPTATFTPRHNIA